MMIEQIAKKVRGGGRVDASEALALYRDAPTHLLGSLADGIRARKHPERHVTYIIDRNVNYTNVCVARCNFCAFYRPVGSGDGYVLGFEEIFRKIDETIAVGGNQLLLQGGHNPDLPIAWF
jgi:cyclic dehypoxanthinyl futalosine synthase